jgi:hypothetical protein
VWVALFSAFDSIAGIATGVLVDGGFTDAADYLFDHSLVGRGFILGWTAQPTWIVVAVASSVALRSNGATVACWATMLASVLFATHAEWTAPLGLLALAASGRSSYPDCRPSYRPAARKISIKGTKKWGLHPRAVRKSRVHPR